MEITPLAPISISERTQVEAESTSSLGKEDFLRLLVTQLSNQDPMNPMDGQEFAAQLAQFSSVEQLINIQDVLSSQGDANAVLAQSMNNGVAAGLIGKTVEAPGNSIGWSGEGDTSIGFDLSASADSVRVVIRDSNGAAVRTVDLSGRGAGSHDFDWDGKNDSGDTLSAGAYSAEVTALDGSGTPLPVTTATRGTVTRVTFGADGIQLWLGDVAVSMGDVRSVSGG